MWVLILILYGFTYQTGGAIDHVEGFASEQSCLDAGNMIKVGDRRDTLKFHCVFAPQLK